MTSYLTNKLMRRKKLGNLRQLQVYQNLIDFSSNDYLGLARSSRLAESFKQEWSTVEPPFNGIGSTGSRLLTGNTAYAQELETRIADFHGYEAGTLFSCGYMANVGLLSAIACYKDAIFFDTGVHASIQDGINLSCVKAYPFRHNDLEHLERRLKNYPSSGNRYICIESIYSTDGSMAPLLDCCRLAQDYEARLIVDEAHAVGVAGPRGCGLVGEQNLSHQVFAQVNTFGKALGAYGAIVLGHQALKEALVNFAAAYIYTTALPFHSLAAIKCSYDLFPQLESERKLLRNLIRIFKEVSEHSSATPIQSLRIEGNEAVQRKAEKLRALGFDIRPLMSPTVRRRHEALRICLHAFNTENELRSLLEHIQASERVPYE